MLLRDRDWLARVNGVEYTGLDMEFEVKKSLRPEPNACSLTIFGMSADHRRAIESLNIYDPKKVKGENTNAKLKDVTPKKAVGVSRAPKAGNIRVELEAGYKGARSLIFRGDLRRGISKHDGAEISIEIEGEDGGRSILGSRINTSFPPGTRKVDVVKECATALGLGLGNIRDVIPYLTDVYTHGTSLNGPTETALRQLIRPERITYSVQNGVLQFVRAGAGLAGRAIYVSQATGLVGRPERDSGGGVMVTLLMLPDVAPGGYLQLDTDEYKGNYLIKSVETKGDTSGTDWYHTCECFPG